jgi:hypothetical protein
MVRLQVSDSAGDKVTLVSRLYEQAVAFFDGEQFLLDGSIDVRAGETTQTMQGTIQVVMWEGDAWFVTEPR